jgi:hypothetical protein
VKLQSRDCLPRYRSRLRREGSDALRVWGWPKMGQGKMLQWLYAG